MRYLFDFTLKSGSHIAASVIATSEDMAYQEVQDFSAKHFKKGKYAALKITEDTPYTVVEWASKINTIVVGHNVYTVFLPNRKIARIEGVKGIKSAINKLTKLLKKTPNVAFYYKKNQTDNFSTYREGNMLITRRIVNKEQTKSLYSRQQKGSRGY